MSNEIEQKGAKEVTTEHQTTPEEEAYWRFLREKWDVLSDAARTLLSEAEVASETDHLIHNTALDSEEYEEAMEKMRLAAAEITGRDRELLARLWRLALAAAASIDPDYELPVAGYGVSAGHIHWYYRTISGMVEDILREKEWAELEKERVEREKQRAERRYELRYTRAEWNRKDLEDLEDISLSRRGLVRGG